MGFFGFCSWFVGGILLVATLEIMFKSVFLTAFVSGMIMGVLGAKE